MVDDSYIRGEYYDLAAVNAFIGNKEEAFYWLYEFIKSKPGASFDFRFLLQESMFKPIMEDERFKKVVDNMKNFQLREKEKFEQMNVIGVL